MSDLKHAINTLYPGGWTQLKIDCGITTFSSRVNQHTKVYTDDTGQSWSTFSNIAKTIGMSNTKTKKYLQSYNISSMQGMGANYRETILYNLSEALKVLGQVKAKQSSKIDSTEANEYMRKLLNE